MASLQPSTTMFRPIHSKQPLPQAVTPSKYHARTSHPKTRTGCRVCKIRRIKCDETKPACTRCTSTGRKCEGLSQKPSAKSSDLVHATLSPLTTYRVSSEVSGNDTEERTFFYLRQRAYDISGYFETEFWDRLVLQISHTEPSVRHALLALGSLCRVYESQDLMDDCSQFQRKFSLEQYNKAIKLMVDYMSTGNPQLEVVLTSCLIFAWLEIMRNDFDAGMCHLKSGLKILDDFRKPKELTTSRPQHVDVSLIYLFSRLKTQATVYRTQPVENATHGQKNPQKVPALFSSIRQARDSLHTLLDTVFQFLRQLGDSDMLESMPASDLHLLETECRSSINQFQDWERSLENSPASIFKALNLRQTAAMCLLHIYHITSTILLQTLFTRSQTIFDQHANSFRLVLAYAEQLIDYNSKEMSLAIFFDMGVIAPLFYVLLKCRDVALRQKALALLERAPCREGMWYRQDAIEYAQWKIATEERGRGQISETEALPEEARIWNEQMREVVIDGRPKVVVRFQRRTKNCIEMSEEITDLSTRMCQLL